MKTSNIFLNKTFDVVKVGDFGISIILDTNKSKAFSVSENISFYLLIVGLINVSFFPRFLYKLVCIIENSYYFQIIGTPSYISPELCENQPYPFSLRIGS